MLNKVFRSRLAILVVGMVVGWVVLVACAAATTATPAASGGEEAAEAPAEEAAEEAADAPAEEAEEAPAAQDGGLLAEVQARGILKCGVHGSAPGMGAIDADGNNVGFDIDFCKAVAAAVLGDADAVEYTTLTGDQRFPALQGGEIDVLIRTTTWTFTRDTSLGVDFTTTTFYDGQGYMVRTGEFDSVEDLDGASVCVLSGTTTELNLADDFAARGLSYEENKFSETSEVIDTFLSGACDMYTTDKSQLAGLASSVENPADYTILPDTISKEPLGPLVRANDSEWRNVVLWTVFALIRAEELGITSANIGDFVDSDDIAVQRLLGTGEDDLGALLGLSQDWAFEAISQAGNYGEIYDRHLTPIGLSRSGSLNALQADGGLLYPPAFR